MPFSWSFSFSFGSLTRTYSNRPKANPARSKVAAPQPQSRFLSLPDELRLAIYTYLFHIPSSGVVIRHCNDPKHHHPPSVLSILQTCRQILQEGEEIFYTINRFRYDGSATPQLLKHISPARRNAVTSVSVIVKSGLVAYQVLPQLKSIPNLRSIHIERILSVRFLNLDEWTGMIQHIRKILAEMEHLEEVKMITPPAKGELADWEKERLVKLESIDASLENFRGTDPGPSGSRVQELN